MELENKDFSQEREEDEAKKKTHSQFFLVSIIIATILLSSIFGAGFGFLAGGASKKITDKIFGNPSKKENVNSEGTIERVVEEDSAIIDMVDEKSPAVVSIIVSKDIPKMQSLFLNPFGASDFFNYFGAQTDPKLGQEQGETQKQKIGGGSGFFVTQDGMIVTNKHVVEDTSADYTVITSDAKEHSAKVIARDPSKDIAVLKIEGNDFPLLTMGDSDSLRIGQTVIAIGNSLGEFSNTVSKGIVSGLRRSVTASGGFGVTETLSNIIQTDAAINPGNSGGPLMNIEGEVIGVNVAMAQGAQNIGFAIPSNQIQKMIEQVKATGKVSAPYLGVRYVPIDPEIKRQINFAYDYGVLIVRGNTVTDFAVIPGSPADKAGIVENDVILEIAGTKIDQNNDLPSLVSRYNVGDEVDLKIWHKGQMRDLKVKLEERK